MAKKRRGQHKHTPVTRADIGPLKRLVVDSGKVGRRNKRKHSHAIGYIHELNKQAQAAQAAGNGAEEERISAELHKLGGLAAYQSFSRKSENLSGFNASRWVVQQLAASGLKPPLTATSCQTAPDAAAVAMTTDPHTSSKLRLLDVGALERNFLRESQWIDATAIDLHSQNEHIMEMDFLEFPVGGSGSSNGGEGDKSDGPLFSGPFDVVCLSLVLNFMGDAASRGAALEKAAALLKPGGHVFVVLPTACVDNSRYCTTGLLEQIMESIGFSTVCTKASSKLLFLMCQLTDVAAHTAPDRQRFAKRLIKQGKSRNNFCITT